MLKLNNEHTYTHEYIHRQALELNPLEKNALVSRSQCYILMGRPDLALKDAEAALAIEKTFTRAIYQKAEALYYLGEFEHSLMYYHRGLRIRPDLEGFKLGVHKAQKAIENAIGASMISKPNTPDSKSSKASSIRSKSSSRLVQLPKQLITEMKYLDSLLKHPDIKCKLVEESDPTPQIQEAMDYLNTRQEFWRQQLPPKFR
ncbi:uncharacterized protein CBL_06251 [Carabus blaptoides fortunei]